MRPDDEQANLFPTPPELANVAPNELRFYRLIEERVPNAYHQQEEITLACGHRFFAQSFPPEREYACCFVCQRAFTHDEQTDYVRPHSELNRVPREELPYWRLIVKRDKDTHGLDEITLACGHCFRTANFPQREYAYCSQCLPPLSKPAL